MNATLQTPAAAPRHRGWAMLVISMVAMAALFLQRQGKYPSVQTPILTLLIALTYVIPWRLPAGGIFPWLVRGVLFFILIMIGPERESGMARFWYLDASLMHLVGTLLAAELFVEHLSPKHDLMHRGMMLITVTGVMASATNTHDGGPMAVLAPIFALALLAALRPFQPQQAVSPTANTATPGRVSRKWLLNGFALVLSLSVGIACASMLRMSQTGLNRLTEIVADLIRPSARVGMSANEQLVQQYNLTTSAERMLKLAGPIRSMHLRGMAYDTYQHGAWLPRLGTRTLTPLAPEALIPPDTQVFRVERLSQDLPLIYVPLGTPGLALEVPGHIEVESSHRAVAEAIPETDQHVVYRFAVPGREDSQGPLCRPLTSAEMKQCLDIPPEVDPKVIELGKSLQQATPQRTIMAVIARLHADHEYTLQTKIGEGDPVSAFILSKDKAHCQYFASAATILLRSAGIPSRYASGFYAHETDGIRKMIVRSCDAHAWCEAWVEGTGWVTVEATPASGTPDKTAEKPSWFRKLREWCSDTFSSIADLFRSLHWYHIAIAGSCLTLTAALVQLLRARRQKRRRPIIRTYGFPSQEYRDLALEFERLLRQLGDLPPGAATWSEHLHDQRRQVSALRKAQQARLDAARQFVDAYNRIRFGNPSDPAALAELRRLLNHVKDTR